MYLDLKSMCYAFRAEDIEIYVPDAEQDNCFIASHMICQSCKHFWHTDLVECYLCGEYSYDVQKCKKDHYTSITGAKKTCKVCTMKKPEKMCINAKCPSNTNQIISKIQNKRAGKGKRGIFENGTESSFKISQIYCLKCGETVNTYRSFLVFVEEYDYRTVHDIISKHAKPGCIVIFKNRLPILEYPPMHIEYAYFEGSNNPKNWQPNWSKLPEIINEVFS